MDLLEFFKEYAKKITDTIYAINLIHKIFISFLKIKGNESLL